MKYYSKSAKLKETGIALSVKKDTATVGQTVSPKRKFFLSSVAALHIPAKPDISFSGLNEGRIKFLQLIYMTFRMNNNKIKDLQPCYFPKLCRGINTG